MLEKPSLRLLGKNELHRLRKFYKDVPYLDPTSLLTAAVAQLSDETIVGMLGFELVPHAGPLIVDSSFRGNGIAGQLYELIESQLSQKPHTGYYTFPSTEQSIRVAEKLGLVKLPWEVWKREY